MCTAIGLSYSAGYATSRAEAEKISCGSRSDPHAACGTRANASGADAGVGNQPGQMVTHLPGGEYDLAAPYTSWHRLRTRSVKKPGKRRASLGEAYPPTKRDSFPPATTPQARIPSPEASQRGDSTIISVSGSRGPLSCAPVLSDRAATAVKGVLTSRSLPQNGSRLLTHVGSNSRNSDLIVEVLLYDQV